MSDEQRLSSIRALGLSAANEGFLTVQLVDEERGELGHWNEADGAASGD